MRELTFTEAAREGLSEEMARDPSVFVVGEGIGARGGNFNTTVGLYEQYGPERLRDTPITERGFIGLCTGAAMTGTRPVVDFMFFDFVLDALGELHQPDVEDPVHDQRPAQDADRAARLHRRGALGGHPPLRQLLPDLHQHPGLPRRRPDHARRRQGPAEDGHPVDDPVVFLEHRSLLQTQGPVPDGEHLVPFGQAAIARAGTDVTVVGITVMVQRALAAADVLAREGVSVEVIDPRTLAPLDIDTILESVHKTGRLLVVDESYGPCGIGAEIAAQVTERGFDDLDAPIRRLNGLHAPIPYSPPLEKAMVPDVDAVVRAIRDLRAE